MPSLKDRIAALEASAGVPAGVDADPVRRAAVERIFAALREALPIVPPTCRQVDHGTFHTVETVSAGASFQELMVGLHRRMHDAMMTADDRRILAALPTDDLELVGMTPEGVVDLYGRLFSEY